jgi:hypothetical protein
MNIYSKIKEFKRKYPLTMSWRVRSHAKIAEKHLNPDETVLYAFVAQKSSSSYEMFFTTAVVLTNKRIIFAQKRLFFGYFFTAITPDMFNDLKVKMGILWGKVIIDSIKETVILSNIDGRALDEIETQITEYMMREKKKYVKQESK